MQLKWRKAEDRDLAQIMHIIRGAQSFMADIRLDQWQDGYPSQELIEEDIAAGRSYVMTDGAVLVATVMIGFDGEHTYNRIYDGRWQSFGKFACVHRLAVLREYMGRGVGTAVLTEVEKAAVARGWHSLRCDTHEDNIPMQRLLVGFGFAYCGTILLDNGNKRLAFEKLI